MVPTFLWNLALILAAAFIGGRIFLFLKMPQVLGELVAGIVLGPSVLGVIAPTLLLQFCAEAGVVLLLFQVGMETDFYHLLRHGKASYLIALAGFIAPLVLVFSLCFWAFKLTLMPSLFMAGALTATSIGITARVLMDLGKAQSPEAKLVIGAAIFDDIFGVLVLAVIYDLALHGSISLPAISKMSGLLLMFTLLTPLLAKLFAGGIHIITAKRYAVALLPLILLLIFLFSVLAQKIGAPVIFGGFLVGTALAKEFHLQFDRPWLKFLNTYFAKDANFSEKIKKGISPIFKVFGPIFFVMVGVSLDLKQIHPSPRILLFAALLFLLAFFGKWVAGFMVKKSLREQFIIGLSMVPRGEVGLVFANFGLLAQVLNQERYAVLIVVIAATTLLPPFLLKWVYQHPLSQ